jgi:hypothetical protein
MLQISQVLLHTDITADYGAFGRSALKHPLTYYRMTTLTPSSDNEPGDFPAAK